MFLSWYRCTPVLCQFIPSDTTSANTSINTLTRLPAPHHHSPPPACPAVTAAARHTETSTTVTGSVCHEGTKAANLYIIYVMYSSSLQLVNNQQPFHIIT